MWLKGCVVCDRLQEARQLFKESCMCMIVPTNIDCYHRCDFFLYIHVEHTCGYTEVAMPDATCATDATCACASLCAPVTDDKNHRTTRELPYMGSGGGQLCS